MLGWRSFFSNFLFSFFLFVLSPGLETPPISVSLSPSPLRGRLASGKRAASVGAETVVLGFFFFCFLFPFFFFFFWIRGCVMLQL